MRVLVYGDSNSWGYLADGLGRRFDRRWPVVMAQQLGCDLVEDCLPGRTTCHEDPIMERDAQLSARIFDGMAHLETTLLAHSPIDLVLIVLGTNDMKARFGQDAQSLAQSIRTLGVLARATPAGPGPWNENFPRKVAVLCPALIGELADDPSWERYAEWIGARKTSLSLAAALRPLADESDLGFLDLGRVATGSPRDPIHLEPDDHENLGCAIADWVDKLGL